MKKVLGISLVAVLAVSPMMARASSVASIEETGSALTTQKYVKGAYNALGTVINTKADQSVLESEVSARSEADGILQSAINTLNGGKSVTGSVEQKIDSAISEVNSTTAGLDGRVSTAEGKLTTLTGNGAGSVAKAEADAKAYADGLVTGLGAVATQGGVDNAIDKAAYTTQLKSSTVTGTVSVPTSGTVAIVTDWENETADTATVTFTIGSADLTNGTVSTSSLETTASADYETANP